MKEENNEHSRRRVLKSLGASSVASASLVTGVELTSAKGGKVDQNFDLNVRKRSTGSLVK